MDFECNLASWPEFLSGWRVETRLSFLNRVEQPHIISVFGQFCSRNELFHGIAFTKHEDTFSYSSLSSLSSSSLAARPTEILNGYSWSHPMYASHMKYRMYE